MVATKVDESKINSAVVESGFDGFDFDEFEGDVESGSRLPYMQTVNPPNVKESEMKKLQPLDIGFFIAKAQAEIAGFEPDNTWKEATISVGDKGEEIEGYLSANPRFAIVHRSQLEAQEKVDGRGWRSRAIAYIKGRPTEYADLCKTSNDWRFAVRYALVFLSKDNKPLNTLKPIQWTGHGGVSGGIGSEIEPFFEALAKCYFGAARAAGKNIKGDRLSIQARSYGVLEFNLSYVPKEADRSPYLYPVSRLEPSLSDHGTKESVKRKPDSPKAIELVKVDWRSLFLSKASEAGKLIGEWFAEYEAFVNLPTQNDDAQDSGSGAATGGTSVKDAGSFDIGTISWLPNGDAAILFIGALDAYSCIVPKHLAKEVEGDRLAIEGTAGADGRVNVTSIVDQSNIVATPVMAGALSADDVDF